MSKINNILLGAKQRATDTGTTGLTLMGVRLYAPVTGRFLSTDPVYGGNANSYVYPIDPVDNDDVSGKAPCGRNLRHAGQNAYMLCIMMTENWHRHKHQNWRFNARFPTDQFLIKHRVVIVSLAADAFCFIPGVGWGWWGLLQGRLTSLTRDGVPREGCRHAEEVPRGVQARRRAGRPSR